MGVIFNGISQLGNEHLAVIRNSEVAVLQGFVRTRAFGCYIADAGVAVIIICSVLVYMEWSIPSPLTPATTTFSLLSAHIHIQQKKGGIQESYKDSAQVESKFTWAI